MHKDNKNAYVADRRQYLDNGKRNRTSGGWMVMTWDAKRLVWVEGACYRTKREAEAVILEGASKD